MPELLCMGASHLERELQTVSTKLSGYNNVQNTYKWAIFLQKDNSLSAYFINGHLYNVCVINCGHIGVRINPSFSQKTLGLTIYFFRIIFFFKYP